MNTVSVLLTLLAVCATALGQDTTDVIIAEIGKIVTIPSNLTLSKNDTIATAVWTHDGVLVARHVFDETAYSNPNAWLDKDWSLQLKELSFTDSGKYTLRIVARYTAPTVTRTLKVLASPSVRAISNPVLDDGSDKLQDVAECIAAGGSRPYTVQWYDGGELVSNISDVTDGVNAENPDLTDSRLVLRRAVKASQDNGRIFTCVVTDAFGNKKESVVSLTVTEPTTTVPTTTMQAYPLIVNFPSEKTIAVSMGTSRRILCRATGVPEPQVVWTKDGEKIGEAVGEKRITITASDYSSSGVYKCTATNKEGSPSDTVTIEVQGKPVISGSKSLTNGTENYSLKPEEKLVTLECQAGSNPKPVITWSAEGKDIDDLETKDKVVTAADSVTSYLNISSKHFTGDDAISKIFCTAANSIGEDKKIFVVSVPTSQASGNGIVIAVIVVVLIAVIVTAILVYFFVSKRRQGSMKTNDEERGMLGFATCCGGSKVKSKELQEDEDGVTGEHVKEVSEEGTQEEKQKLTEAEEKPADNDIEEEEEKQQEEENEEKKEKNAPRKRKIPLPIQCCRGRKKTITKEGDFENEDQGEEDEKDAGNSDAKPAEDERDSGKGDTLGKAVEDDVTKK